MNEVIDGRPLGEVILDVHASYHAGLAPLFERSLLRGAAHITGGASFSWASCRGDRGQSETMRRSARPPPAYRLGVF
jgi:phosphoribosylaminoimidazole (AIR) synthetase